MIEAENSPLHQGFDERFEIKRQIPCQLYLISPPEIDDKFPDRLARALENDGVSAFQLRLKGLDEHSIARAAEPLQRLCADRDVAFIVNDSIALAKRLGADGVHLGQSDGDPREAREILGREAQIGVTCHNSRHFAMEAGDAGVDYIAFGAFYQSGTKEIKHFADIDLLKWWSVLSEIPCVAIGGITATNAKPIIDAGADFIAVSGAIWNHADGESAAVAEIKALF